MYAIDPLHHLQTSILPPFITQVVHICRKMSIGCSISDPLAEEFQVNGKLLDELYFWTDSLTHAVMTSTRLDGRLVVTQRTRRVLLSILSVKLGAYECDVLWALSVQRQAVKAASKEYRHWQNQASHRISKVFSGIAGSLRPLLVSKIVSL